MLPNKLQSPLNFPNLCQISQAKKIATWLIQWLPAGDSNPFELISYTCNLWLHKIDAHEMILSK